MTRQPADPEARLAQLRPVLANLKPGELVNAENMAKIARMTWRNLEITIAKDADFPIVSRGGMGVAWQFDAHAVIAYLVAGAEALLKQRADVAAKTAAMIGLAPEPAQPAAPAATMTTLQMKQMIEAMAAADKLRQRRGELVPLVEVSGMLNEIMSTLTAETLAFIGKHDPAGQLSPQLRKAIEDHQRALLVHLRDKVQAVIERPGAKHAA